MASPVGSLADSFAATSLNTAMWTEDLSGTTTISYATTGATVTMPTTATASEFGAVHSVNAYDFTGSCITLHVITAPNSATQAYAGYTLGADSSNNFRFYVAGGSLVGVVKLAGTDTVVFSPAYSSSTHAYWRISESAGVATFLTSANGVTWTSQGTLTHGLSLTSMTVDIYFGTWQAETSPGTFKFNLLNSGWRALPIIRRQQAVNRSYTY